MKKTVFIQIGLNQSIEYAFLAKLNFKEIAAQLADSKFYVPDVLLNVRQPHTVIAIDMNPDSNAQLREKYKDIPNLHIWDYVLWHTDIEKFEHGDYIAADEFLPEGKEHAWKFIGEAITIETLCQKIKALPGHEECKVVGLHANIEGAEKYLLEGETLRHFRPWVIRVGVNHYDSVKQDINEENPVFIRQQMEKNAYIHIKDPRDSDEYFTFLRNDLFLP